LHPQHLKHSLKIDNKASKIIQTLNKNNFEAYLVGGAIRDLLLDKEPKDFDIATNATPEQIKKLFKRARVIGRRFKIVHILVGRNEFIEVSTFRGHESNTTMLKRDNNFGTIKTDAFRRDFTINSMYYDLQRKYIIDWHNSAEDIKNKKINSIGDVDLRFNQDPVRMLRALRFATKLGFSLSLEVESAIHSHKNLLLAVPAARLFEECLKLFHNTRAVENYNILSKFLIFNLLFPYTKDSGLITTALENTANRVRQGLGLSPAFIFAIFLYGRYLELFNSYKKSHKNKKQASKQAIIETLIQQNKIIQIPKFAMDKIANTWSMQHKLEQKNPQTITEILSHKDFRMAYDFLLLRSQSINPELISVAKFWQKAQKL
jgi:poly(A) polymerase